MTTERAEVWFVTGSPKGIPNAFVFMLKAATVLRGREATELVFDRPCEDGDMVAFFTNKKITHWTGGKLATEPSVVIRLPGANEKIVSAAHIKGKLCVEYEKGGFDHHPDPDGRDWLRLNG